MSNPNCYPSLSLSLSLNPSQTPSLSLPIDLLRNTSALTVMASTPLLFLLRPLLFSATLFSLQLQPLSASSQSNQLLLHLTHSLTYFNFPNATIHHLLKISSIRSAARHRRHQDVYLPLSIGSDYTLSLSVGPPPDSTTIQLYMDTGSDLVWFPCSPFECILCEGKETPSASPSPPPSPPAGSHLLPCRAVEVL